MSSVTKQTKVDKWDKRGQMRQKCTNETKADKSVQMGTKRTPDLECA